MSGHRELGLVEELRAIDWARAVEVEDLWPETLKALRHGMPDDHVVGASGFPLGASRKMLEEDVNAWIEEAKREADA
jgi:hypothetical protein